MVQNYKVEQYLDDRDPVIIAAAGMPPVEALKTMCICAAMAFVHQRRPRSLEVEPE